MKVIGLGKENIEEGKVFDVSEQVAEILIKKGLVYEEGKEKPSAKKGRKPKA
jgi:hypothetical protein